MFKGKLLWKIILAPSVFVVGAALAFWHFSNPEVLTGGGTTTLIYIAGQVVNMILLSIVGTIGGQLTFPE